MGVFGGRVYKKKREKKVCGGVVCTGEFFKWTLYVVIFLYTLNIFFSQCTKNFAVNF